MSTLTPIEASILSTTAPVSKLSKPKKYMFCNMAFGFSIFLTDFSKPLYTSTKSTGTIRASPAINSVLPK